MCTHVQIFALKDKILPFYNYNIQIYSFLKTWQHNWNLVVAHWLQNSEIIIYIFRFYCSPNYTMTFILCACFQILKSCNIFNKIQNVNIKVLKYYCSANMYLVRGTQQWLLLSVTGLSTRELCCCKTQYASHILICRTVV